MRIATRHRWVCPTSGAVSPIREGGVIWVQCTYRIMVVLPLFIGVRDVSSSPIRLHRSLSLLDLPLHTACSRHQTEVVKLLVESDPSKSTLYVKADNGSLPLHSACRYQAPASVVMLLLDGDVCRRTLFASDVYGQLPLHAACRNGAHPDVIDLLLRYDEGKETVMMEDHVG
jgi:hypothetical protein